MKIRKRNVASVILCLIFMLIFVGTLLFSQNYNVRTLGEGPGYKGASRQVGGRLLLFGVNEYTHIPKSLNYAVNDANDFGSVLEEHWDEDQGLFSGEVYSDPTSNQIREAVELALDEMREGSLSTLILFFSGRGYQTENGDIYLALKNTKPTAEEIEGTGFNLTRLVNELEEVYQESESTYYDSLKIAMFVDAGRNPVSGGGGDKDDPMPKYGLWPSGKGLSVVYSTSGNTPSWEIHDFQNGLFTEYLIKGIESCGADSDGDGLITFTEIGEYTKREVLKYSTSSSRIRTQNPEIRNEGWREGEFVIAECHARVEVD